VIGFLSSISEEPYIVAAFRRGLAEQGFLEGRNVKIEYRYAHGDYDRLPALATELVSMPVAVIVALPSSPAALAAKSATRKIPIAFSVGGDVVELGLVASYNSPGGNVTGVSVVATSLTPKRLELLHELLPKSAPVALLVNPTNMLTAIYTIRQFPEIGGLISFGTNTSESHRQVGIYAGRILKGEEPADLPVQEPTKFELIINLRTAKALGLTIPPTLLARADEVIE